MTTGSATAKPTRVLILCTGNSARSQIAEALFTHRGQGRFEARSAGVAPRLEVHPDAIAVLREHGIDWRGHLPRHVDEFASDPWDLVITVCDNAKESCPVFPGKTRILHWGMPDPAAVDDPAERSAAFRATFDDVAARLRRLVADAEKPGNRNRPE